MICWKTFKHSSTLYAHKKNCDLSEITDKLIIKTLLKIVENGTNNTNISNNNSHNTNIDNNTFNDNKTFNLNFFLNETCKDAMNINEFVSSVKVSLDDLENTGRQGYVEGITNIVLKNLKKEPKTLQKMPKS